MIEKLKKKIVVDSTIIVLILLVEFCVNIGVKNDSIDYQHRQGHEYRPFSNEKWSKSEINEEKILLLRWLTKEKKHYRAKKS